MTKNDLLSDVWLIAQEHKKLTSIEFLLIHWFDLVDSRSISVSELNRRAGSLKCLYGASLFDQALENLFKAIQKEVTV